MIGDVLLMYWPQRPMTKLIQWYNRQLGAPDEAACYTHAAIIVGYDKGNPILAEALGKGFLISPYDYSWLSDSCKTKQVLVLRPKVKLHEVEQLAQLYEGRGYGWYDFISIGLSLVLPKFTLPLTGAKKIICSEAVARILYDASDGKIMLGYDPEKPEQKETSEFKKYYDRISPLDLYNSKQFIHFNKP